MSNQIASQRRIILTGASGVGKTSLIERLAPKLSLSIIPELGRKLCLELGHERIGDISEQERFKQMVLEAQIETEDALESFISDRSAIDCWVLWQRWNICSAMSFDTESYYQSARQQSSRYTQIIYIPPMFPPADDGFRWTDLDYQRQIDRLVRMTLYDWDLWTRTYQVQSEGLERRIQEVLKWLEIGDS
jgi:nicotinamide riboside kinase